MSLNPGDRLTWLALAILHEATKAAGRGPVAPSASLRLALAYLATVGTGERFFFDAFWRNMQLPPGFATQDDYRRGTHACSYLQGIMRTVGITPNNACFARLTEINATYAPEGIRRRELARAIRRAGEQNREESDPAD